MPSVWKVESIIPRRSLNSARLGGWIEARAVKFHGFRFHFCSKLWLPLYLVVGFVVRLLFLYRLSTSMIQNMTRSSFPNYPLYYNMVPPLLYFEYPLYYNMNTPFNMSTILAWQLGNQIFRPLRVIQVI